MMRLVERSITLANDTTVELDVPHGSTEHMIRLEESISWRFGSDKTLVDGGGGMPMIPNEALVIEATLVRHTIYVRQISGSPATLHWALLVPVGG